MKIAKYIKENYMDGTLRELFRNYFSQYAYGLPADDDECTKEILEGIVVYFRLIRRIDDSK
jgi:hypothetical protein